MFISDGIGPFLFRRKMERTHPMREKMDGQMYFSRQIRHPSFAVVFLKVFFHCLYLDLACKQSCFPPREMYK